MNTVEMIGSIEIGQKAWSASLGCVIERKKYEGIIIESSDKGDFKGEHLGLSSIVLNTDDWMLSPLEMKDFNEIFSNMKTDDGVTLVISNSCAYYFSVGELLTSLDFLNMKTIIEGRWLNGFVSAQTLQKFGYVK